VLIPVFTAVYLPAVKRDAIWSSMIAGTLIWLGYLLYKGCVFDGSFFAFLRSSTFQYELTNGSVYGFLAAIAGFFAVSLKNMRYERK
jgi:hypothetical protein